MQIQNSKDKQSFGNLSISKKCASRIGRETEIKLLSEYSSLKHDVFLELKGDLISAKGKSATNVVDKKLSLTSKLSQLLGFKIQIQEPISAEQTIYLQSSFFDDAKKVIEELRNKLERPNNS